MFIPLIGERSWQRLKLSAIDLYSKSEKSLFEPPFRALRGNVRTPSMARWKARGRLYICRNWTFFAISYGWDIMSGNRSKSAFFKGGGSLWAQISEGRGRRPPITLGVRVAECGIKISAVCHLVLSPCTHVTDRRTDRITTPKTALAYARAVKVKVTNVTLIKHEIPRNCWMNYCGIYKLGRNVWGHRQCHVLRTVHYN